MDQRAILVVEDTAPIAEIIETVLNDIPAYQASAVGNGADALAFIAEVKVDLVLLDINLPGLDVSPFTTCCASASRPPRCRSSS